MGKAAEQIARDLYPVPANRAKRAAKRLLARQNRRWAKRDPDGAPRRHRYRGWYW